MSENRPKVSEALFEKIVDGEVWRRLNRDPRYRHADTAEEQKDAELAIEQEVIERYEMKYEVV